MITALSHKDETVRDETVRSETLRCCLAPLNFVSTPPGAAPFCSPSNIGCFGSAIRLN